MKTQITLITSILFSLVVNAQELQTTVEKAPAANPKWKASVTSYYYNFEGTKASTEADYFFENATLNMQLATLQYQYSPSWTFQVLAQHLDNYVETNMPSTSGRTTYKDRTTGLGDTMISGITPLYATSDAMILADVGVSLPTGDINQKNEYAPANNYAYNMQNGSGTVDAVTGLTALSFRGPFQLGSHLTGIFRNGRNANGYALGNLYRADAWIDYNTKWGVTPRITGFYKHKDAIQGWDEEYERAREIPAYMSYYEFYHHAQVNWDVSAAVKYAQPVGPVTVAAEVGVPMAQSSSNYDNAVVTTEYFGNLSVSGNF